jgi:hypothetical protein
MPGYSAPATMVVEQWAAAVPGTEEVCDNASYTALGIAQNDI